MLHIFLETAQSFDDQPDFSVAIVTTIGTLLGIVLTAMLARFLTNPKTPTTDPDKKKSDTQKLLSSYTGDQNEFIRLVVQDSKELHQKYDNLESELDKMKKEKNNLITAFGRYVMKLATSWGSGGKMPYPDEEDMTLLEETLPADWRRRPHKT